MKTNISNNTLTIFLEGRIDTNNAALTEQEIFSAVEGKGEEKLSRFDRFDFRFADIREIFFTGLPDFMEYALVEALLGRLWCLCSISF
ncbi:MAG: hypothetical protein IJ740_09960 [Ruminococcus sp.]|nr:hypothetical protein [Ruminococcus sp.]